MPSPSVLIIVATWLISVSSCCYGNSSSSSSSFSCGKIHNISCPFYLKDHPHNCHKFSTELSCQNNRTLLEMNDSVFYVEAINYGNSSIRLVDSGLAEENICSLNHPLHPFSSLENIFFAFYNQPISSPIQDFNKPIMYIDCPASVNTSARYLPAPSCSSSSVVSSYVVIGHMQSSEVENNCMIRRTTWVSSAWPNINQTSFLNNQGIHNIFYGVELPFRYFNCLHCSSSDPSFSSDYCLGVRNENTNLQCHTNHCDEIYQISFYCGKKKEISMFIIFFCKYVLD